MYQADSHIESKDLTVKTDKIRTKKNKNIGSSNAEFSMGGWEQTPTSDIK